MEIPPGVKYEYVNDGKVCKIQEAQVTKPRPGPPESNPPRALTRRSEVKFF